MIYVGVTSDMLECSVTPGLQGDAPAAKSNVQPGSVFSAAGLQ